MSFLTSTQSVQTETPLPSSISPESAIALLHDHTTFQNLQPLVTANVVIPEPTSEPWLVNEAKRVSNASPAAEKSPIDYRSVTTAVPMGLFSNSIVTTGASIDTENGLVIVFQAPLGLYGTNKWSIVKSDEGGYLLREEATLTGFSLMMGFVMGTKKKSHTELAAAFLKKLEGK